MKRLVLVLALVFVASCASFAQSNASIDIYGGQWNLISAPRVPFNPNPSGTGGVFAAFGSLNNRLFRFDAPTQSQIAWTLPSGGAFGKVLLGEGYWINNTTGTTKTMTYAAVPNGIPNNSGNKTDMWISLPGDQNDGQNAGGWHWVGTPFEETIPFPQTTGSNIKLTDGTQVKTFKEAYESGWCERWMYYFDAVVGTQKRAGYTVSQDYNMRSGKGYMFRTLKDNLALIIPANP